MNHHFSTSRRAGNLLFLSGQCGSDISGTLVPGGLGPERAQTWRNIKATLAPEGLALAGPIAVTRHVRDINSRAVTDAAYLAPFNNGPLPTRTTVEVSGLSVEMTAMAAFPEKAA